MYEYNYMPLWCSIIQCVCICRWSKFASTTWLSCNLHIQISFVTNTGRRTIGTQGAYCDNNVRWLYSGLETMDKHTRKKQHWHQFNFCLEFSSFCFLLSLSLSTRPPSNSLHSSTIPMMLLFNNSFAIIATSSTAGHTLHYAFEQSLIV